MAAFAAGAMVTDPEAGEGKSTPPGAADPAWPKPATSHFALAVIIAATMLNFFDSSVFGMMAQRIKVDFMLSDEQLGFLLGPANIVFYVLVGVPMARLVDIYPRRLVLAGGIALTGAITALGGLAQSFGQLFASRMLVGAGGSAHAPGAYSMLADLFPPRLLPRAIGYLQIGFIGGTGLGIFLGGQLVSFAAAMEPVRWMGLVFHGWQFVLMGVGAPGLLIAAAFLFTREPERRGLARAGRAMPVREVLAEIRARRAVYGPLFLALAFSVTDSQGLLAWRTPYLVRTHGWTEAQIGNWSGPAFVLFSMLGVVLGTWLVERLARRHRDANVRATAILFACSIPFAAAGPLMPTGGLAILCFSISTMFGLASAVPQNAAIQRITPNQMRGQVTALYLFIFTVFAAMGSLLIGSLTERLFGGPAHLWKAMALTGAVLMPAAAITVRFAMKPYAREIERIEAAEAQAG